MTCQLFNLTKHSPRMILLIVALSLVAPASAMATGSVTMSTPSIDYIAGSSDGANAVEVDYDSFVYQIGDSEGVTAGSGCTQTNANLVSCASIFGKQINLDMGDGLDEVSVTSSVPSSARVSIDGEVDGVDVDSQSAVAALHVDSSNGNILTGSGADVLNIGGSGYVGLIMTGSGADSISVETDLDPAPPTENFEDPYGVGALDVNYWPVKVHSDAGDDYIDASAATGGVWYEQGGGCDLFLGGSGDDWIGVGAASTGNDTLVGGDGDDLFYSYSDNTGDDMIYAGAGNDILKLYDNTAEENFDGGAGLDVVLYRNTITGTASVSLDGVRNDGAAGNDNFTPTTENVVGAYANGGITTTGSASDNVLGGASGADDITGLGGEDVLYGYGGNDVLDAYDGQADVVNCGDGTDSATVDTIDTVIACESVTTP